jgi:hypothetical protein
MENADPNIATWVAASSGHRVCGTEAGVEAGMAALESVLVFVGC